MKFWKFTNLLFCRCQRFQIPAGRLGRILNDIQNHSFIYGDCSLLFLRKRSSLDHDKARTIWSPNERSHYFYPSLERKIYPLNHHTVTYFFINTEGRNYQRECDVNNLQKIVGSRFFFYNKKTYLYGNREHLKKFIKIKRGTLTMFWIY